MPSNMSSSPRSLNCNQNELFTSFNGNSKDFFLSFVPPHSSDDSFLEDELEEGKKEWCFTLVGHGIGKRPFYGSLLVAVSINGHSKIFQTSNSIGGFLCLQGRL